MRRVIDNTEDLSCFCRELLNAKPEFIAVDTEFISNRKYKIFPKLCLIQIGYNNTAAIIDVLSDNLDVSILNELFLNSSIIKVFHDFKQDILALLTIFKYIPRSIIDTQMMAMLCHKYTNCISYSELVYSLLGVKLMKGQTRTNWLLRPLSSKQVEYGLADVSYLCSIYKDLHKKLSGLSRLKWMKDDIQAITSKLAIPYSTKNELPNMVRQLLCEYRNDSKLLDDISDAQIYRISCAKNYNEHLFKKVVREAHLDKILELVSSHKKDSSASDNNKAIAHLLHVLIQQYCLENNISYQSVSSSSEINRLLNNEFINIRLLQGWRYREIGNKIINLLKNNLELKISIDDNELKIGHC